jgi:hypothetical protein
MQAVDWYIDFFDDAPQPISDAYNGKTGFAIKANKQSFTKNNVDDCYVKFTAFWNGAEIPVGEVTWNVTGLTVASVGPYTRFAAVDGTPTPGNLTIGGGQPEGRLQVTAAYDSLEGMKTRQYVITVRPKP